MYYVFIFIASLLFSVQFLFNQKFEEKNGSGLETSLVFSIFCGGAIFLYMFILNKFKLDFSIFSLIWAAAFACVSISCTYAGIKSLSIVNLSKYSIYMMLGGMLLPAVFGVLFCGEALTITKIICCLLIACSLFFTSEKGEDKKGGKIFFLIIFILNGLSGVVSTIHQTNKTYHVVDTYSFMAMAGLTMMVVCTVLYLISRKKGAFPKKESIKYPIGHAICNGTAEVLVLTALMHLDASIQYPIITGGTIVFSTLIGFVRGEKPNAKNVIAVLIAFTASIVMAF